MRRHETIEMVGDFETTVYESQTSTEVWASALVPLFSEKVIVHNSLDDTFRYLFNMKKDVIVYYHNLKFDGSFWLDFLYTQGFKQVDVNTKPWEMHNKTFKCLISDMGAWYSVTIRYKNYLVTLRDSLKLLPFSVAKIGKDFKTKHQKLEIEYTGFRYKGGYISPEERKYIENDVLVVKEALEILKSEGHEKTTIGSCCLDEYKTIMNDTYKAYFYDLTEYRFKEFNLDTYIRKSYRGGWCYLKRGCENIIFINGCTADVNSLYPSMMSSESGNYYPVGEPHIFGASEFNSIKDKPTSELYYFVRFTCGFKIKPNYLPFVQIKGSYLYKSNEMLETSEIFDKKQNKYVRYYIDREGNLHDTNKTEMCMTCTDFRLFLEHYEVYNLQILDGVYFKTAIGIFDEYIEKYKKIKMTSKGALRQLAKLFLNNLYGKFATNPENRRKVAKYDGIKVSYDIIQDEDKPTENIAIGSAITSYARNFTIRHAQKNYKYFIYADTDSLHCNCDKSQLVDIKTHPTAFNHWSIESEWDRGLFIRQKTYVEHVIVADGEQVKPYFDIKACGMPKRCKELFNLSMTVKSENERLKHAKTERERRFLKERRNLKDFKQGLCIPSKLMPKVIRGGTILRDTDFTMK